MYDTVRIGPLLLQVAMAHAPVDEAPLPDGYSVSDEFFMYKFSKEQAGLSGLAFDEGKVSLVLMSAVLKVSVLLM